MGSLIVAVVILRNNIDNLSNNLCHKEVENFNNK